ncbi:tetratricopeptide repeat protein [Brevundimonas subvibrioides]|uniref:tetratricopeptide repeat protein n=1 Tax=Brevundimonas subvibrioides TaxID=74313 RepID=UPI0022B5A806|nr:tetratricopeptide repeat protein [Brevundimonas subvibrioides]
MAILNLMLAALAPSEGLALSVRENEIASSLQSSIVPTVPPAIRDMTTPEHAEYVAWLAEADSALGESRFEDAKAILERVLDREEQTFGPDHPLVAVTVSKLAASLYFEGRYGDALPYNERALKIYESWERPEGGATAISRSNLAINLDAQGRYGQAQPLHESALTFFSAVLGPNHPLTASGLLALANNLNEQRQYALAQSLYERALGIMEAEFGSEALVTGTSLNVLANNLYDQRQYDFAQSLYERALNIVSEVTGPNSPETANVLYNLAQNLDGLGRHVDAQTFYERALRINETVSGLNHPKTASSLNGLALNLYAQGRYAEAQLLLERALSINKATLGPEHPDTTEVTYNLAENLRVQGLYVQAQPLFERALEINETMLGLNHPKTASSLSGLALNLYGQGLYGEAQPLFECALRIDETILGPDDPDTANSLSNLATNFHAQGQYDEAQPLYERALAIREAVLRPNHPDTATSLSNLAGNFSSQGQYGLAQPLFERALRIREAALGPNHPDTAESLSRFALNLRDRSRLAEAHPILERALRINETVLGRDHPYTVDSLNSLAFNLYGQGRYAEAQPLSERALRISETSLGPDHPTTALSAENTAISALGSGMALAALTPARQALEIRRTLALREGGNRDEASQVRLADATGNAAVVFTRAAWSVDRSGAGDDALRAEAFQAVQWQEGSSAGRAQVRAAARRALSPAGQALAREWETALEERAGLDRQFSAAAGGTDEAARTRQADLVRRRDTLDARITDLTTQLERDYPQYLELLNPSSLSVADLQPLLHESEALVLVSPGDARMPEGQRRGIVFVVTREGFDWAEVGMEPDDLEARIGVLRDELKPDGGRGPDSGGSATVGQGGRGFDRSRAYELYQALFGDERIAALLADKEDWILSPQGSLLSLPFAALPMAEPVGDDADPRALIDTPWLGTTRALSVLPNLSTLRQVRGEDRREAPSAPDPFRGFGFATYNAGRTIQPEEGRFLTRAQLRANRVRTLDPLDSTGDELFAIAAALDADPATTLDFTTDATEARVQALSADGTLARARVIVFATHGLIPPELGLDQAALAFSPPGQPEGDDDGLLTAAEAAGLRLNADWVILSACNTASSNAQAGSEALAGLARAFFFAGARSLLVSHWKVGDTDATALTTSTVRLQQQDPALSRARAMQQSMQGLMQNPNTAHPTHWAPFILVGAE